MGKTTNRASLLAGFRDPRGSSFKILWPIPVSCSLSNWRAGGGSEGSEGCSQGQLSLRFWVTVRITHSDSHPGPEADSEAWVSLTHMHPHHLRPVEDEGRANAWLNLEPSPPSPGPCPGQPPGASRTACPVYKVLAPAPACTWALFARGKLTPAPSYIRTSLEFGSFWNEMGKLHLHKQVWGIKWEGRSLRAPLGQSAFWVLVYSFSEWSFKIS